MDNPMNARLSQLSDLNEGKKRQSYSLPPPQTCDLCSKSLSEEKYYIDGLLKNTTGWANACPKCYFKNGMCIAWGEGQLYMQVEKGSWLLVAGFPPLDEEDGNACAFCGEEFEKKDMIEFQSNEWACKDCAEDGESIMEQFIDQQK